MSARLRHRRVLTVAEYAAAKGEKPDTVRARIRRGQLEARDLNAGTGKRPRWRIPARELLASVCLRRDRLRNEVDDDQSSQ